MQFAKKIFFLFLAIILIGGMIIFWLWSNYAQRRGEILQAEQAQVQNQYSSTINSYRLVSKTLYDEVVNTQEVTALLAKVGSASPAEQAKVRQQLHSKFLPMYNRLRSKNFKQFNLYLADSTNFLNMYKPDEFGEKVLTSRPSIRQVVEGGKYVEGFEEGRLFNGFRYVFPLYSGSELVGVLETSVSFSTFEREMSDIFSLTYRFMLKKAVVSDVVYAGDTRTYAISEYSKDYYLESENIGKKKVEAVSDEAITAIGTKLRDSVVDDLSNGRLFSRDLPVDGVNYLVSFVPIDNIAGQQVAYLVAYDPNDVLYLLKNDVYVRYVFGLALIAIVLFLAYYIYDSQQKILDAGERLKNITKAMSEGLMVVNMHKEVVFYNPAAEAITGFTVEEMLGNLYDHYLKFVYETGNKANDVFVGNILNKGISVRNSRDVFVIKKTGERLPLSISASPLWLANNHVGGCIIVFRDITHEREIDKAKTEFVSLASHQLKTPLSAVNWYAEMLMDGDAGALNDNQKDFLREITAGNQRMVKLVNSLLNVSRIDMGALSINPEPVDLREVMDSVIGEQQFAIEAKEQEVAKKYDPKLPKINLDLNLLRIVLQNLVSNAVKYTREKGHINISIEVQNVDAFIKVVDDGYGIPKKEQVQIFSKLFRADNVKSKKVEGTGLGLYVAKAVVESFGGKIWFESVEEKGTTFFITLPLAGVKKKEGAKGLESNT